MINFSSKLTRESGLAMKISYRLANNENPLGPSIKALQAIEEMLNRAHHYPDTYHQPLKHALATHLSVQSGQITIGNGSENILELIVKSYLSKNTSAVLPQYTFATIPRLIKEYGARVIEVPVKNWVPDIKEMIKCIEKDTRLLFLVNPNNPTGTYTTVADFNLLLQSVPPHVLIVLDEAYFEYVDVTDYPEALTYLAAHPNLIMVRTFSKAYGLAGLRLGYAVSSMEVAAQLDSVRLPFHVNSLAAKAGCAALDDKTHIKNTFAANQKGRQQMLEGLQQLQLSFIPSVANFITIAVGDAATLQANLLQHGVLVKTLDEYGMPNHVRVTIGTSAEITHFLQLLGQLL
jgi:histidinol-phosphate aminotransferase